ncbi:MAG TPA: ATP-binding protein, partial [Cryobacterium sp.]|nr:ATP-binding protein [Cryobacterium sp.]
MGAPRPEPTADLAAVPSGANRIGSGPFASGEFDAGKPSAAAGKGGQPRKPISRASIETIVSRSIAGVAVVFALQTLPLMIDQMEYRRPVLGVVGPALLALAVGFLIFATVFKIGIRAAAGFVALIYLVALFLWPPLMLDPNAQLPGKPWLWYLLTVATTCAAIAFPVVWAAAYTVVAPVVFGIIRSLPSGGGADALLSSLDAVYAILLGEVVLIIIFMLRQAADAVDAAQTNALQKYAIAVRQHATEVERVEVDSIVHDTVLATLLSAAGARGPKAAELAAAMARNAIARLDDAGSASAGDESAIPFARLSDRIRQAASAIAFPFTIIERDLESLTIPVHASEAIYSATVQAMVNSIQHAGPADESLTRTLTLCPNLQGGCTIEIADSGVGFDLAAVPNERLGLRVSIQERIVSVGGAVRVRTSPGNGTTIVIDWPRPVREPNPLISKFSSEEIPVLALDDAIQDEGVRA